MKVGELVEIKVICGEPKTYGVFLGTIRRLGGRVLRFGVAGKERLICENWWLANGGESVEEVLETSDEKDAGV